MNSIQNLINTREIVGNQRHANGQPTQNDKAVVDSIFAKLKVLFPAGAPKADMEGEHKREWLKTLAVQRIVTMAQIQAGLNRARQEQGVFWPSPRLFCQWCKASEAEQMGLPNVDDAFREALRFHRSADRHVWSHDLVRLALRGSGGSWLFADSNENDAFKIFENNYTRLMRLYLNGDLGDNELDLPRALPARVSVRTPCTKALENIANARRKYGLVKGVR